MKLSLVRLNPGNSKLGDAGDEFTITALTLKTIISYPADRAPSSPAISGKPLFLRLPAPHVPSHSPPPDSDRRLVLTSRREARITEVRQTEALNMAAYQQM